MIDYQEFLNRIPESLDWIEKNVIKGTLSYSLDEIEKVHLFYENRLKDFSDVEHLKKVFIAYMGEAFIKHFGGNWELSKIKNDEAYGTAIINNWGSDEGPHMTISPYVWTEIIRKRGKMERTVRQIFEGNIKRFKTNNLT